MSALRPATLAALRLGAPPEVTATGPDGWRASVAGEVVVTIGRVAGSVSWYCPQNGTLGVIAASALAHGYALQVARHLSTGVSLTLWDAVFNLAAAAGVPA